LAITAAIPPVFEACCTVELPEGGEERNRRDLAVWELLSEQSQGGAVTGSLLAPAPEQVFQCPAGQCHDSNRQNSDY
jgi:hypothetical protein